MKSQCSKCGEIISPTQSFCSSCGTEQLIQSLFNSSHRKLIIDLDYKTQPNSPIFNETGKEIGRITRNILPTGYQLVVQDAFSPNSIIIDFKKKQFGEEYLIDSIVKNIRTTIGRVKAMKVNPIITMKNSLGKPEYKSKININLNFSMKIVHHASDIVIANLSKTKSRNIMGDITNKNCRTVEIVQSNSENMKLLGLALILINKFSN